MTKCIIFDIDETLYSYWDCHKVCIRVLEDYVQKEFGWEEGEIAALWKAGYAAVTEVLGFDNACIHDVMLRIQWMLEQKGINPLPYTRKLYYMYWDTLMEHMQIMPGVKDFLEEASVRGIRLGLATDMTAEIQYRKLETIGLIHHFDFIVTSEEAGCEKPHRGIYDLCLKKAGCSPEECLFVGDNWDKDIEGALGAGMKAAWYRPKDNPEAAGERKPYFINSYAADGEYCLWNRMKWNRAE